MPTRCITKGHCKCCSNIFCGVCTWATVWTGREIDPLMDLYRRLSWRRHRAYTGFGAATPLSMIVDGGALLVPWMKLCSSWPSSNARTCQLHFKYFLLVSFVTLHILTERSVLCRSWVLKTDVLFALNQTWQRNFRVLDRLRKQRRDEKNKLQRNRKEERRK